MPCTLTLNDLQYNVLVPTTQLQRWVDQHIDISSVVEFSDLFDGKNRRLWSREILAKFPPMRLGQVFYPPSSSEFAVAYVIVPSGFITALNEALPNNTSSGLSVPVTISMYNDAGATSGVDVTLFPVAAYPLSAQDLASVGTDAAHLLVLVDFRFYMWGLSVGNLQAEAFTWQQLLMQRGFTQVSLGSDSINPAYQFPSGALSSLDEPLAAYIDAIAENVGLRCIVPSYTEPLSLYLASATTGAATFDTNLQAASYSVGGDVATIEIQLTAPAYVSVSFPVATAFTDNPPANNDPNQPQTPVYLASGLLSHIETNTFSSPTYGRPLLIRDTANYVQGQNDADVKALAQQITTDIYDWMSFRANVDLPGIFPWLQDGVHSVTWLYTAEKVQTSVRPAPLHQLRPDEMHHDVIHAPTSGSETPTVFGSSAKILDGQYVSYNFVTSVEASNTGVWHNWGIIECANPLTANDLPIGHLIPRVSIGSPSAAAPAGSEQWDDYGGCFWVYSKHNSQWVQIGGLCGGGGGTSLQVAQGNDACCSSQTCPGGNAGFSTVTKLVFDGGCYTDVTVTASGGVGTVVYDWCGMYVGTTSGSNPHVDKILFDSTYFNTTTTSDGTCGQPFKKVVVSLNAGIPSTINVAQGGIQCSAFGGGGTIGTIQAVSEIIFQGGCYTFVNVVVASGVATVQYDWCGMTVGNTMTDTSYVDRIEFDPTFFSLSPSADALCGELSNYKQVLVSLRGGGGSGVSIAQGGTQCTSFGGGGGIGTVSSVTEIIFQGGCYIESQVTVAAGIGTVRYDWCGMWVDGQNLSVPVPYVDEIDFGKDFVVTAAANTRCTPFTGGYNKTTIDLSGGGNCTGCVPVTGTIYLVNGVTFNPTSCVLTTTCYALRFCNGRLVTGCTPSGGTGPGCTQNCAGCSSIASCTNC